MRGYLKQAVTLLVLIAGMSFVPPLLPAYGQEEGGDVGDRGDGPSQADRDGGQSQADRDFQANKDNADRVAADRDKQRDAVQMKDYQRDAGSRGQIDAGAHTEVGGGPAGMGPPDKGAEVHVTMHPDEDKGPK